MGLNATVAALVKSLAADGSLESTAGLDRCLRYLAIWRSKLIEREIVARHGPIVLNGPFAGMRFRNEAAEGCLAAKLLGCYEAQLHPFLLEVEGRYDDVIDIGCAEGYYAVGLARITSKARLHAHDTNPAAQAACRELALLNGVDARVSVGGAFHGEDFACFADRRTLVIVDVEGAEDALLRPDLYPALARMGLIVECHDVFKPGLCDTVAERFRPSHAVKRIDHALVPPMLPPWFDRTAHLDQLLAMWEWRSGPTPWLVMTPKS